MKHATIGRVILFLFGLFAPQIIQAQGTMTFLSNLGEPPGGSVPVGSDSWFAADFISGNNPGGYLLDSVQLAMTDSSGSPSGFTVMLYSGVDIHGGVFPGTSLGTLTGSADPAASGLYTYTPASSLALSPNAYYYIVLTAGTTVGNGAYGWSVTSTASAGYTSYHWGGETSFAQSGDGLSWNYTTGTYGQFSLNATPTPEPGVVVLFALGGLLVGFRRWKANRLNEKNHH